MKVLIISHNPLCSRNNMGKTLLSLFRGFSREELCQLYIYPGLPEAEVCASFYRMTDKDALGRKPGGEVPRERIGRTQGIFEDPADAAMYRNPKNKSPLRRLLRDAMWRCSGWYSATLKAWLEREKPDRIFVAPGAAEFLYDFALEIAGDRGIPIACYICDEFYFVKEPKPWLERYRLNRLKRKIEALMEKTAHLVVISEELKAVYGTHFGVETTVLMTGAAIPPAVGIAQPEAPEEIRYFGNIRCGRFRSLGDIGEALEEINRELGTDYRLAVYTGEQDREVLAYLGQFPSIVLRSFVTGEEYLRALRGGGMLAHVEAFDGKNRELVKHSVSTKIADSLASGVPLLAYGPEEVSSMAHLERNHCALMVTDRKKLKDTLLRGFTEEALRRTAVENALAAAKRFHNGEENSRKLKGILEGL